MAKHVFECRAGMVSFQAQSMCSKCVLGSIDRERCRAGAVSSRAGVCGYRVKRRKCMWWMPWRSQAMKDVRACVKPRGAGNEALIRGCPNGGTHFRKGVSRSEFIGPRRRTRGTETSQYPQEQKSTEIPKVVASEIGRAFTF